jgi:hypothetical protein
MSVHLDNFDSDYYLSRYPDLQTATQALRPPQKHAFLFKHFVQHGRAEKRSYRLKSGSSQSFQTHPVDSQSLEQKYRRFFTQGAQIQNYEKVIDFDCNGMQTDKSSRRHRHDKKNSDNDNSSDSYSDKDKPQERHRGRCKHKSPMKDKDSSSDKGSSSDRDSSAEREASVERYLQKSRERDQRKALERKNAKKGIHAKVESPKNETFSIEWR